MSKTTPRLEQRWWLTAFLASRQVRLCIPILALVVLTPPKTGWGMELCFMKRFTGAPCPGCGVTRSGSNLVRGDLTDSIRFHPFGLILHPVLLGLAVFSILPDAIRRTFALRLLPQKRIVSWIMVVFWIAFFGYGLVRWWGVVTGQLCFPPGTPG